MRGVLFCRLYHIGSVGSFRSFVTGMASGDFGNEDVYDLDPGRVGICFLVTWLVVGDTMVEVSAGLHWDRSIFWKGACRRCLLRVSK